MSTEKAANSIHISLKAEEIFKIGSFGVTNSMFGFLLVFAILILGGIYLKFTIKKTGLPTKPQLLIESFYCFLESLAGQTIGEHKARKYLGIITVIFLLIIAGSWFGLLPGVLHLEVLGVEGKNVPLFRAPTTDLSATTAIAIIAFATIQYSGIHELGTGKYLSKFISFKSGGGFLLGLIELLQEFVRVISFSFRLFGNIFAGEVLLVVIGSLTKFNFSGGDGNIINYFGVPAPALIIVFEFFVALIQAYVFVFLMSVFVYMAAEPPHGDHPDQEKIELDIIKHEEKLEMLR